MTSAAGANDEGEPLTLEVEPERRRGLSPRVARFAFLGLAGVALLALVVAVLAILLAPDGAVLLLVGALVVLVLVVVAEIVLLLLARPGQG